VAVTGLRPSADDGAGLERQSGTVQGQKHARDRTAVPARLVTVDQHAIARAGLSNLLRSESDLQVVGEAATGAEATVVCRRLRPDLVVMEARLPDVDALALTRVIRSELPATRVLVFTLYENAEYAREVIRAGASGYVLKGSTRYEILAAIREALAG